MKTYFAHWVGDYDTPIERAAVEAIESAQHPSGEVVNPNTLEHAAAYQVHGMGYFVGLVSGLDACVFMRMPCGSVGAGVAKEVERFLERGKPVWELTRDLRNLWVTDAIPGPVLSVEETRAATRAAREAREAA